MLSKMLKRAPALKQSIRPFANEVSVQHATPVDGVMPATPHAVDSSRHKSHKDLNKMLAAADQASDAAQKQYYDTLADVDAR